MEQGDEEVMKFPAVLRYANARQQFDAPTEANLVWVWDRACESGWVPQPGDTPRGLWEELRARQPMLVAWLEHLIIKRPDFIPGRVIVEQRIKHWTAQLVICVVSETSRIAQTIYSHSLSPTMGLRMRDQFLANETFPTGHEIP